jgi:hypothetical protein
MNFLNNADNLLTGIEGKSKSKGTFQKSTFIVNIPKPY